MSNQKLEKERQINAGFIPTGGALVSADVRVTNGTTARGEPKTERMKLPAEALMWLYERLQAAQGFKPDMELASELDWGKSQPPQQQGSGQEVDFL